MSEHMRVVITSPPDREDLVAEIYCGDVMWAEVNRETGSLRLEIYPNPQGGPWVFDFVRAIEGVEAAKRRLESFGERIVAVNEE